MNPRSLKPLRALIPRLLLPGLLILGVGYSLPAQADEQDDATRALIERHGLREHNVASRDIQGWQKPERILVLSLGPEMMEQMRRSVPDVQLVMFEDLEQAKGEVGSYQAIIGICHPDLVTPDVHWIQIYSAGAERCTGLDSVRNDVALLTNGQRLQGPEIADHSIAMMMALVRGLDVFGARQTWQRGRKIGEDEMWEVSGRTLLVVGLGGVGTEIARVGHGLGMRVLATRNSSHEGPDFVSYVGLADELLELAAQADVVINAAPLTPSTTGIFNETFFEAMPDHGYFINIGRGKSVVTDDLVAALNSDKIAGAGLDVTDPEPLPDDHPLWTTPRVIITPHVAGNSDKIEARIALMAQENLRRYVAGEPLLSVVDVERGY